MTYTDKIEAYRSDDSDNLRSFVGKLKDSPLNGKDRNDDIASYYIILLLIKKAN